MKCWPQQLNFALWCATTSCGVPRDIYCRQIYHSNVDPLVSHNWYICNDVEKADQWYVQNGMIVNARKHQAIISGQTDHQFSFPVNNELDMFRMTIDNRLNFDRHISTVCNEINNQFNVMLRFRNIISKDKMLRFTRGSSIYPATLLLLCCMALSCGTRNSEKLKALW